MGNTHHCLSPQQPIPHHSHRAWLRVSKQRQASNKSRSSPTRCDCPSSSNLLSWPPPLACAVEWEPYHRQTQARHVSTAPSSLSGRPVRSRLVHDALFLLCHQQHGRRVAGHLRVIILRQRLPNEHEHHPFPLPKSQIWGVVCLRP